MRLDQKRTRIEAAARVLSGKVILHELDPANRQLVHEAYRALARDVLEAADLAVPVSAVDPVRQMERAYLGEPALVPPKLMTSMSEDEWTRTIADRTHEAVLRMRPHEKLMVERHEAGMGKPLFTITFNSPTGGAYG